ncbi:hypothetical protein HZA38_02225 [Candidatus Peregrinibacteria bacterium]|nr:hypothetical protein [Candidatus Peregrinibacteria bacterium]
MKEILEIIAGVIHALPSLDVFSLIPGGDTELAKAFQSGEFSWNLILAYGLYLAQFGLGAAGLSAVIYMMIGGYRYIMPTEDAKEKGKDSIKNALIGFTIIVLAWAAVDVVIILLTERS